MHVDPKTLDTTGVAPYISQAKSQSFVDFIMHIIPDNIFSALLKGIFYRYYSLRFVWRWSSTLGSKNTQPVLKALHNISEGLFAMMRMIMKLAPLGHFRCHEFYHR